MKRHVFWENYQRSSRAWKDHGRRHQELRAILIHSAKVVYFPVPKAANSSIKKALCPSLGIDPDIIQTHDDVHSDKIPTFPARALVKMKLDDWVLFTVTRHPFDRAHSAWRDKVDAMRDDFSPSRSMGLEPGDSFLTFLMVTNFWPTPRLNDHFIPQTELLRDPMAKFDLKVFQMEQLENDWEPLCDLIEERGGVRPLSLPHLNASGGKTPKNFTPPEKILLNRLYGSDLKTLGYSR